MRVRVMALMLVAMVVGVLAPPARAQGGAEGEVQLSVVDVGPGGAARPGTWTGVQVRLNDLGLEQRDVVLRIEGFDPDGDRPLYDRVVTTNPGLAQTFWVYLRLPFTVELRDAITVRAYEAIDTGSDTGQLGFRPGRILGSGEAALNRIMHPSETAIGVMGDWDYGLRAYGPATARTKWPVAAHDVVATYNGLRVARLPDRWQGLAVLDALVWGRGVGATDPGSLTPEQAGAIEDWVIRGGHLIVVLPSTGQEWVSQGSNRLLRLLPEMQAPVRHDGVDLDAYRELLTKNPDAVFPGAGVVHELVPAPDADATSAACVIRDREGRCVAMRRTIGSGAVTVVGLDLGAASMRVVGPSAETFWHRVLGRRGRILTTEEIEDQALGSRIDGRDELFFDDDIAGAIAKTGSAAQGVLLGLVLFAAYWLIAGPVGYLVLRNAKRQNLAWPAFVATTLVFTAIAWTGAALLRPKRVNGSHVTYLEQVHGQDTQRARTWVSLLIPRYGEAEVAVDDDGTAGTNLLSAWESPGADRALGQTFPDNRGYRVEARAPERASVPSRQTVKQLMIDWAGAPRWSMIRPLIDPGDPRNIALVKPETGQAYVTGNLAHDLPGSLEDVVVIFVERQDTIRGVGLSNRMVSIAYAHAAEGSYSPWDPGEALDLAIITGPDEDGNTRRQAIAEANAHLETLLTQGRSRSPGVRTNAGGIDDRLTAVRLFSQLPPAEPWNTNQSDFIARRLQSHGWDLGRWFTQPCVIVIGHLVVDPSDASVEASPIPLTVDGREVPMSGRTVVSWVYPLGDAPTTWAERVGEDDQGDAGGDAPADEDGD